ncbi:hypothetical protein [Fibrivirga algicola]|uniref:ABC transporter ATPase n=1 Tax=Fibrivirga algicola TaxID=2950420 RepID=A0ABX0QHB3_9BACT|nr:hypothetical protein [Fibrivirga algicola]NID11614.1 hypothetical protein [Fibrivirga algicola]
MVISFDQITPDARLWVYQANRVLTADEITAVEMTLQPALANWAAHGHPLLAAARVVDGRFLLLAVDEGAGLPSGCSIDSSVHSVQAAGQVLGIDFMDRSVTYLAADGSVQSLPLGDLKAAFAEGTLTADTLVFNTLIKTKAEYLTAWHVPAAQTWLKRYIKPVSA